MRRQTQERLIYLKDKKKTIYNIDCDKMTKSRRSQQRKTFLLKQITKKENNSWPFMRVKLTFID